MGAMPKRRQSGSDAYLYLSTRGEIVGKVNTNRGVLYLPPPPAPDSTHLHTLQAQGHTSI